MQVELNSPTGFPVCDGGFADVFKREDQGRVFAVKALRVPRFDADFKGKTRVSNLP